MIQPSQQTWTACGILCHTEIFFITWKSGNTGKTSTGVTLGLLGCRCIYMPQERTSILTKNKEIIGMRSLRVGRWTWEEGTQEGKDTKRTNPVPPGRRRGREGGGGSREEGGIASKNDGCKWCSGAKQESVMLFFQHLICQGVFCPANCIYCYATFHPLVLKCEQSKQRPRMKIYGSMRRQLSPSKSNQVNRSCLYHWGY